MFSILHIPIHSSNHYLQKCMILFVKSPNPFPHKDLNEILTSIPKPPILYWNLQSEHLKPPHCVSQEILWIISNYSLHLHVKHVIGRYA